MGWAETETAAASAPETTVTPIEGSSAEAAAPAEPAEAAAAPETASEPAAEPTVEATTPSGHHKVVAGDTLWGIAGTVLKDPYQWSKIWEANKTMIPNPDLIFPDQEFVIPSLDAAASMETAAPPAAETSGDKGAPVAEAPKEESPATEGTPVAEAPVEESPATAEPTETPAPAEPVVAETPAEPEPEPEVAPEPAPLPAPKKVGTKGAGFMGGTTDAFLAGPDWEYDGYILRDRDLKTMISQGDVVFLNVGASAGVEPRMYGQVYRLGKKVKDPFLKRVAGKILIRVGTVMVTSQVTEEACTAVVTNSVEPILVGDLIKFEAR